jgi:phage shock protein A
MGVLSRMSTIFKSKMNAALDKVEDPRQTLEYSYQRQLQMLQDVKRGLADVVASKKRIELQAEKVKQQADTLEAEAKQALAAGREDLARSALERKAVLLAQIEGLQKQIADLQAEQDKLTLAEQRLSTKVESFRTQKEVIKAQFTAAQATVKVGEAATGLSEEMADVGLAVQRAQDKTDSMRARAAAIDELVDGGVLDAQAGGADPVADELGKLRSSSQVESDLARLKAEVGGGSGSAGQ